MSRSDWATVGFVVLVIAMMVAGFLRERWWQRRWDQAKYLRFLQPHVLRQLQDLHEWGNRKELTAADLAGLMGNIELADVHAVLIELVGEGLIYSRVDPEAPDDLARILFSTQRVTTETPEYRGCD